MTTGGVVGAVVIHEQHLVDARGVPGAASGTGPRAGPARRSSASGVSRPLGRREPPQTVCASRLDDLTTSSFPGLARRACGRPPPPRSRKAGRSAAGGSGRTGSRPSGPSRPSGWSRAAAATPLDTATVARSPRSRNLVRNRSAAKNGNVPVKRYDARSTLEPAGSTDRSDRAGTRVATVMVVVLVEVGPRPLIGRHAESGAGPPARGPGSSPPALRPRARSARSRRRPRPRRRNRRRTAGRSPTRRRRPRSQAARVDVQGDALRPAPDSQAHAGTVGAPDVEQPGAACPTYR